MKYRLDGARQFCTSIQCGSLAPVTYEIEECEKTFTIRGQFTPPQREQMQQQYNDVLSDVPGRTDLLQHEVRVIDNTPSWQPSYDSRGVTRRCRK